MCMEGYLWGINFLGPACRGCRGAPAARKTPREESGRGMQEAAFGVERCYTYLISDSASIL